MRNSASVHVVGVWQRIDKEYENNGHDALRKGSWNMTAKDLVWS